MKKIIQTILNIFKQILTMDEKITKPIIPIDQTIPPPAPKVAYYWNTPIAARHSVRLICDEEGLSVNDKNILDACVHVESGYNPLAEHMNKDKNGNVWSTDYGICQINDYWNIGTGKPFPSVQYVLDNPESCIRWMCKQWKAGNQHLWASFTSGAYKKFL